MPRPPVAMQQLADLNAKLTATSKATPSRAAFMAAGATSTDHGHPTAATADLSNADEVDAILVRNPRRLLTFV